MSVYLEVLNQTVDFSPDGPLPEDSKYETAFLRGMYDKQKDGSRITALHSGTCYEPDDSDVGTAYWEGYDANPKTALTLLNKWSRRDSQ